MAAQDGEKYVLLILLKEAHVFSVTCDDTDNAVFTAFFALEGSTIWKLNDPQNTFNPVRDLALSVIAVGVLIWRVLSEIKYSLFKPGLEKGSDMQGFQ